MNKINNPITEMSALALSDSIKSREVSCVEVMHAIWIKLKSLTQKSMPLSPYRTGMI
ncbi:hypothetical protein EDF73_111151 [Raoultella sp. BIGb0138]|nr:hypothetical protein EDF73_111151 [Raoultella sp. BIGb0138]